MRREQLIGLDLVRFVAAMLVMMYHFTFRVSEAGNGTPARITDHAFDFGDLGVSFGWVGVEVFFVLSGYVIAYSAYGNSPLSFLRSRVLRLAPAAWICATITVVVALAIGDGSPAELARRYIASAAFFPDGPWIDGVYWTLGIEIAFYAAVLVLLTLRRFDWIEWAAGLLAAATAALVLGHLLSAPDRVLDTSRMTDLLLVRHGCFFAVGVMLWLMRERGFTPYRGLVLASGLLAGAGEVYLGDPHRSVVPVLVWTVLVGAIALSVGCNRTIAGWTGRAAPVVRLAGLATYPLYLVHQLVGSALMIEALRLGAPPFACVAVAVAAMVALSFGIVTLAEPPVARALRGTLNRVEHSLALAPAVRR